MTACVFLGPTLPVDQARRLLDATYLPPVRQGDVCRAVARFRPRAIGIVDGYFHQVPSVWHKEILFAMAEGVHVFGSASMGALRAAELHEFGMQGVGEVFEAFRDGRLEDDDEVAVVHAPAEIGFVAASEAMVNIRRTLDAAAAEAIVAPETRRDLVGIAKALFYPARTFAELLKRGAAAGLPKAELDALDAWLAGGRIDVKQDDARAMLRLMSDRLARDAAPMSVGYRVEHTTMWDNALRALATGRHDPDRTSDGGEAALDRLLLDEIRLDPEGERRWQHALLQVLALDEAARLGLRVDADERRGAATAFRLAHGLQRGADLRRWLAERGLDRPTLEGLLGDRLLAGKVADRLRARAAGAMLGARRLGAGPEPADARARARQRLAAKAGERTELTDDRDALTWYFQRRLQAPPPDDLDAFARRRGFRDGDDFRQAVTRAFHDRSIDDEASFDE